MNKWLARVIIFIIAVTGCIWSLQYARSHFKSDRQLILLNRTCPDFHHFLDIEKQGPRVISQNGLKEYFDYFHLVAEAMPQNSDGMLMLGYLDEITGNGPQAEDFLKKANQLDPQFFFIEYNLALVYFKQGDYRQCTDFLQKALAIAPGLTVKRMMGSVIYRQIFSSLKDSDDIIAGLRQAYQDADILLMESLAKQKEMQKENVNTEVHAHIM